MENQPKTEVEKDKFTDITSDTGADLDSSPQGPNTKSLIAMLKNWGATNFLAYTLLATTPAVTGCQDVVVKPKEEVPMSPKFEKFVESTSNTPGVGSFTGYLDKNGSYIPTSLKLDMTEGSELNNMFINSISELYPSLYPQLPSGGRYSLQDICRISQENGGSGNINVYLTINENINPIAGEGFTYDKDNISRLGSFKMDNMNEWFKQRNIEYAETKANASFINPGQAGKFSFTERNLSFSIRLISNVPPPHGLGDQRILEFTFDSNKLTITISDPRNPAHRKLKEIYLILPNTTSTTK